MSGIQVEAQAAEEARPAVQGDHRRHERIHGAVEANADRQPESSKQLGTRFFQKPLNQGMFLKSYRHSTFPQLRDFGRSGVCLRADCEQNPCMIFQEHSLTKGFFKIWEPALRDSEVRVPWAAFSPKKTPKQTEPQMSESSRTTNPGPPALNLQDVSVGCALKAEDQTSVWSSVQPPGALVHIGAPALQPNM